MRLVLCSWKKFWTSAGILVGLLDGVDVADDDAVAFFFERDDRVVPSALIVEVEAEVDDLARTWR